LCNLCATQNLCNLSKLTRLCNLIYRFTIRQSINQAIKFISTGTARRLNMTDKTSQTSTKILKMPLFSLLLCVLSLVFLPITNIVRHCRFAVIPGNRQSLGGMAVNPNSRKVLDVPLLFCRIKKISSNGKGLIAFLFSPLKKVFYSKLSVSKRFRYWSEAYLQFCFPRAKRSAG
jgi:hypothetical protein